MDAQEDSALKVKEPTISPAARKMATEARVDLNKIQGSGKHGAWLFSHFETVASVTDSPKVGTIILSDIYFPTFY